MDFSKLFRRSLGGLALLAAMLGSSVAFAQNVQQGYDLNNYQPAERGSEWFVMDSLDIRGKARPAIGITADLAYRPLVTYNTTVGPTGNTGETTLDKQIVRNMFIAHAGASLVLLDRLRLGVNLPIAFYNYGTPVTSQNTINGITYNPPASTAGIGDLRLGADLRLFGEYADAFQLAIGANVWLPTGKQENWLGDGQVRAQPHLLLAGRVGMFEYAARGGATFRHAINIAGYSMGTQLNYGASVGLRLADNKLLIGPEAWGATSIEGNVADPFGVYTGAGGNASVNGPFQARTTNFEAMLGAHYTIGDDWRVGGGVSKGFGTGIGTPVVRGLVSLEFVPGIEKPKAPDDRDHDGVPDIEDACPDVAGVRTADAATNGCPAVSDRDGDGIADEQDACPDAAGVKTDDPRTNGCPADRDGDGIADGEDACPDTKGERSDDPSKNGCPGDKDGDGIADNEDACPDAAGIRTQDPKTNGCPDPDRDHDGVLNEQDACPDEAGKEDPDPKKNGCPKAFIKDGQIRILDQVKFKFGSAKIDSKAADSEAVLEAVLQILNSHPEIKKVRVEGHTDNKGKAKRNLKLSKQRAESVVKWLTKKGVDKSRLAAEGFGQEKPIDTNDTEQGRTNNRRVEFHIEDAGTPAAQ